MKIRMLVLTGLLMACNGSAVDEEDCWYCDDETGGDTDGADTDSTDTDGKDTDGKDTDGKDTDGKDTDGGDKDVQGVWSGAISVSDGTGSFGYASDVCELSYPVTQARELTDCAQCAFAWEIKLDSPTITVDDNCENYGTYAGALVPYGHQDPDVLLSGKGDSWAVSGQSNVKEGMWYFTQGGGGK